jgi:hypothetical protein
MDKLVSGTTTRRARRSRQEWGQAVGQGIALGAGKLINTLLKPSTVKSAVTATQTLDDLGKPIQKPGTTQAANVLADELGLKGKNSQIVEKFYSNPSKFKIVNNIDEMAAGVDDKLTSIIENKNSLLFKRHLEPELMKVAQMQGVQNVDEVALNMSTAGKDLKSLIGKIKGDSTLVASAKADSVAAIKEYQNLLTQNPEMTYGQFKQLGSNLFDSIQQAKDNPSLKKGLQQIYDTLVENRAKTLDPNAFKAYSTDRGVFDKLDRLFKVRLSEGELQPGQISLVGKLGKFTDEIKQASNYNALQDILEQGKKSGVEGIGELGDSIDEYLLNLSLNKAKPGKGTFRKLVQGTPILEGVANTVGDLVNDPVNKARILQKTFQLGIFDPTKTTARVSETLFPRIQTLGELVNARRLLDAGTPMKEVVKNVSPQVAKIIKNVAKNKGVQAGVAGAPGQIITRSLNQILYEGNGMNQ